MLARADRAAGNCEGVESGLRIALQLLGRLSIGYVRTAGSSQAIIDYSTIESLAPYVQRSSARLHVRMARAAEGFQRTRPRVYSRPGGPNRGFTDTTAHSQALHVAFTRCPCSKFRSAPHVCAIMCMLHADAGRTRPGCWPMV